MAPAQHIISLFGQLADDFFVSILLLKSADEQNLALPFLHAHVLELSAKAACDKLSVNVAGLKNGHEISSIYDALVPHLPDVAVWAPTPTQCTEYRKIWFPEDAPQPDVGLPPPDELDALELAYFVTNVMDLKYGFTKKRVHVSVVHVAYKDVNRRFLALFKVCRDAYADADQNRRLKEKIARMFGPSAEIEERLHLLLGI